MTPLWGLGFFFLAFYAFCATMHLLDAKANCERLQQKFEQSRARFILTGKIALCSGASDPNTGAIMR